MIKFNDGASMGDVRTGTIHAIVDEVNTVKDDVSDMVTEVADHETRLSQAERDIAALEAAGPGDGGQGPAGEGVPTGGTAGQILAKASGADYDTEWVAATAASSVNANNIVYTLNSPEGSASTIGTEHSHILCMRQMTLTLPQISDVTLLPNIEPGKMPSSQLLHIATCDTPVTIKAPTGTKIWRKGAEVQEFTLAAADGSVTLMAMNNSDAWVYWISF